jgi:hypothetical protein
MMFKYSEEERVGRNEVKELYRILMSGPQSNALEEFILDIIIQNKRASVDFLVKKMKYKDSSLAFFGIKWL